jgi:hypothetical protein
VPETHPLPSYIIVVGQTLSLERVFILWSWGEISGMVVTMHVLPLTRSRDLDKDIEMARSWNLGFKNIRNCVSWIQLFELRKSRAEVSNAFGKSVGWLNGYYLQRLKWCHR